MKGGYVFGSIRRSSDKARGTMPDLREMLVASIASLISSYSSFSVVTFIGSKLLKY